MAVLLSTDLVVCDTLEHLSVTFEISHRLGGSLEMFGAQCCHGVTPEPRLKLTAPVSGDGGRCAKPGSLQECSSHCFCHSSGGERLLASG